MEDKMKLQDSWGAKPISDSWQITDQTNSVIAEIKHHKDAESNARLIAASPYMLSALKAVTELIGDEDLPDNGELSGAAICDMVRSAVNLATNK